ncbi:MAG: PEP-CTERM sorting domain-containing protein [Verrucomicrobiales bacterium]
MNATNQKLKALIIVSSGLACVSPGEAGTVFFGQAVDATGTPVPGGFDHSSDLPLFAPIRDSLGSPNIGFVQLSISGDLIVSGNYPRSEDETYIYNTVPGGIGKSNTMTFSFYHADPLGNPDTSSPLTVSDFAFTVDGRPSDSGFGFVTSDETNTVTLNDPDAYWEVARNDGSVSATLTDNELVYRATDTAVRGADTGAQFIAKGDNITSFQWVFQNDVNGTNNGTHFQLDLEPQPVPEPSSAGLFLGSLILLSTRRRSRL